jgi:hypothetical protein
MKSLKINLIIVCLLIVASTNAQKKRATISDGERAAASWAVQNLMSTHEYYHAAGMNTEELDAYWVDIKGPNANTATFASPAWVMNGIETIRGAYGKKNQENREKALEAISKKDPTVKNIPENLGAGHEWVMHTSTTPVIEIAGDGKTAKGIWYSPGMGLMTDIDNPEVKVNGTFFWEKYGADFIKENGVWKIWHMQMAYDYTPSTNKGSDWLDFEKKNTAVQAGEKKDALGMPKGFTKPNYSYPAYTPQRVTKIYPPIPEAYYTFKETFSY